MEKTYRITYKEKEFLRETLNALLNGARIGTKYYTITLNKIEFNQLLDKLGDK